MKHLEFSIDINADVKKVYSTVIDPEKYKEWVGVSFPGSYFEGKWEQGENLRFLSTDGGGTLANLEEVKPNEYIAARHAAIINKDGSLDKTSETAKGWIGTTEIYTFSKKYGGTNFKVEVGNLKPEWERMFADSWPKLLDKLKELSEN